MFACIYGQEIPRDISLADFAYQFSPRVEETAIDTVVLDIEGCEVLFGSAYQLADIITKRASCPREAGGIGCKVNVAVAANPDTAVHAARLLKGLTFISPGEELTALGELPVEALGQPIGLLSHSASRSSSLNIRNETPKQMLHMATLAQQRQEIIETLKLWGVETFRDFAALPTIGISERLGQEGVLLQQLAAGKSVRHLNIKQSAPDFENSLALEYPLAELEPLSFVLARLLNQLCARLHEYAMATNEIRVQMTLENRTAQERKLNLPYPMRDHKVFLKLLLLDTEMHPPPSPVVGVSIAFEPVKPRVLQNGLFIPLAPEPEKLELTLARLAKLVGYNNFGSPELVDTHRPDAFQLKRFALKTKDVKRGRKRLKAEASTMENRQCFVGFRVFRPPLPAIVQAERGYPTDVSAWGANRSVYGKVTKVAGPWRTSGDWWRENQWARDEWNVAIESRSAPSTISAQKSHVLYRIYRDLKNGSWFVAGLYD